MDNKLINLKSNQDLNTYHPILFKLSDPTSHLQFEKLLKENQNLIICDEIQGQVEELIKSKNPKIVFKQPELTQAAKDYLGNTNRDEYGVWVFYPWSNRLVHLLDENDFIEVRTNRNQYKITPKEKDILSQKKIGIIGLSVGQSIALTIAMERICGEIRLIDFDKLELSNLNRIRSGVHNLELSKVKMVAREIAEMDPFLKVTCYPEGLTEENMEAFFLEGGKLDACIEVCDGVDIKIMSRIKAKELQVPVVMVSSDRGTTDIERFDLHPDLPLLHGFISHLDPLQAKNAKTNEEKSPYILAFVGIESASSRVKASMLEIQQSITTWPQLASGVVLGGTICTDVCRRIFLDEFHDSGRYFFDIEDVIKDKDFKEVEKISMSFNPSISDSEMIEIIRSQKSKINDQRDKEHSVVNLDQSIVKELVSAAILAPSGANAQPWKWKYYEKRLYLFLDLRYQVQLLDCKRTVMIASLGAATENLVLKAHEFNLEVASEFFDINDETKLIAAFEFYNETPPDHIILEPHLCDELVKTIPLRISNRKIPKQLVKIEKYC